MFLAWLIELSCLVVGTVLGAGDKRRKENNQSMFPLNLTWWVGGGDGRNVGKYHTNSGVKDKEAKILILGDPKLPRNIEGGWEGLHLRGVAQGKVHLRRFLRGMVKKGTDYEKKDADDGCSRHGFFCVQKHDSRRWNDRFKNSPEITLAKTKNVRIRLMW